MNRRIPAALIVVLTLLLLCGWGASVGLAAENRGHAAPANLIPKELKDVSVKDTFIPAATKEAGVIQTVQAYVVVARGDLSQAYFAANGDKLYEQDVIFTLKDSRCRIKLLNDDVVTIGDNSRLAVKEVAGNRETPEKKSVMSLVKGKAMFYAIRLLNHKSLNMTVESPTAVAGVRGTKFGMEIIEENGNVSAGLPLLLADNSPDWGRHLILAQAGRLPVITTAVHGFDGTVAVTSTATGATTTVGAGQSITTTPQGMGSLMPTPPQVSQRFQSVTNVPPPGGGGGTSGGTGGGQGGLGTAPANTAGAAQTPVTTLPVIDNSNVIQNQNTTTIEQQAKPVDTVTDPMRNAAGTITKAGYFTGLLTNQTAGTLQEVFISQYRYDMDSAVWARGLDATDKDFIRVDGGGKFGNPYLKWIDFDSGTKSPGALNTPITHAILGENNFMEWGWATIPYFTLGGVNYAVDNRAYYLLGLVPSTLSGFSGTARYSGSAYGTYWTAGGGVNMSGTFSTDVNITSGAVSNFSVSVTAPNGPSAYISGASGSLASDASFSIDPSTGSWQLYSSGGVASSPTRKYAYGSLYSDYASYIGGVWAMSTATAAAEGIFQGSRGSGTNYTLAPGPGSRLGYFVGMLENATSTAYADTFMSTAPQDLNSSSAIAAGTSTNTVTISGSGRLPIAMTYLKVGASSWSGVKSESQTDRVVTIAKLGSNTYLEWGTWQQANAMLVGAASYAFRDQGYYVVGDLTSEAQIAAEKAKLTTGTYSGTALGTYFSGGGSGVALSGTFRADVAFQSGAITNFDISVSGSGGKSVVMTGGSGSFGTTGNYTITGATTTINGNAASGSANGAVYGASGQATAGGWKADGTAVTTDHAAGIYYGTR